MLLNQKMSKNLLFGEAVKRLEKQKVKLQENGQPRVNYFEEDFQAISQ
jgi:hypothetical protein